VPNIRYPSEVSKLRDVVVPPPGLCRSRCVPECWQRSPYCPNIRCTCFGYSLHTLFRCCGRVLGFLRLWCELRYLCRTGVRSVTSTIATAVSRPFRLLLMRGSITGAVNIFLRSSFFRRFPSVYLLAIDRILIAQTHYHVSSPVALLHVHAHRY